MRTVTAPDGRQWKVGRQWLPWRVRLRRDTFDGPDIGDAGAFDDLGGVAIALGLLALAVIVLFVVFPVVVLAVEIVVVLLALIAGVFARLVLRKPWHVLARTGEAAYRWPVKGWRASGARVEQIADALASGSMPPGAELLKR